MAEACRIHFSLVPAWSTFFAMKTTRTSRSKFREDFHPPSSWYQRPVHLNTRVHAYVPGAGAGAVLGSFFSRAPSSWSSLSTLLLRAALLCVEGRGGWRLKELKGGEGGRSGVSVKVGGVKVGGVEGGEGGRSGEG